ncbi:GNAT family N-acetyltransferase [Streptomyces sp. NPDC059837]|uniref:GNAT family N-acetyltransferase n=1 Tax=Streptomyces sp. NPDC059837 TaxID=3346968 RepID=UPI00364B5969
MPPRPPPHRRPALDRAADGARSLHRKGLGRQLTGLVEERFRHEGRDGIRLAVLENNPASLVFWSSLGWQEIDRRTDNQHGRPCVVMHKRLT